MPTLTSDLHGHLRSKLRKIHSLTFKIIMSSNLDLSPILWAIVVLFLNFISYQNTDIDININYVVMKV